MSEIGTMVIRNVVPVTSVLDPSDPPVFGPSGSVIIFSDPDPSSNRHKNEEKS
jgi:hypothetical protein